MKIAICDSSTIFMNKFIDEVKKINPYINVVTFKGYKDLVGAEDIELFDSFFIATEIDCQSGVDIALNVFLKNKKAEIVFITENCEKYCQSIFEYADRFRPFAMLNKPVSRIFLRHVFTMLENVLSLSRDKSIIVRLTDKDHISLDISDILYIQHNNRVSYIYTINGKCYMSKYNIKWFEDNLPGCFLHCAKSCIVNAMKVRSVNEMEIFFGDESSVWCSRRYQKDFVESLDKFRSLSGSISEGVCDN